MRRILLLIVLLITFSAFSCIQLAFADDALLRQYEPILYLHPQEEYLPMDVDTYVEACGLWEIQLLKDEELVKHGDLKLSHLGTTFKYEGKEVNATIDDNYLVFVKDSPKPGKPGVSNKDLAQAAKATYSVLKHKHKIIYYGRQTEKSGYIILQYWFFYAYNSWGAYDLGYNVHEGDWEMITIFLEPPVANPKPKYVAYSQHVSVGGIHPGFERRKWDDSVLGSEEIVQKIGNHPVVYVALGSHAAYFNPGGHLVDCPKLPAGFLCLDETAINGIHIGPGQDLLDKSFDERWDKPVILEDKSLPAWAKHYSGKWGIDSLIDALIDWGFGGPQGPVYQKTKWDNPVVWADVGDFLLVSISSLDSSEFAKIKLYATVEDAAGRPVLNLGSSHFKVYEDNTRSSSISVSSVGSGFVGTSVSIVMDTSGSMEGAIGSAKQAAIGFVNNLGPQDKASLIKFRDVVTTVQPFTDDKNALIRAIDSLYADGETALYDAVYKGIAMTSTQAGIKAVVVLTDGKDNHSVQTAKEVIEYAQSVSVPVYVVALGSEIDEQVLQLIAKETDGQYYRAPSPDELQQLYDSISERLQNLYEVSYTTHNPERDGTYRSVTVRVTKDNASGQDTTNYTAPALSAAISGIVTDKETDSPIQSAIIVVEHETAGLHSTDASLNTDAEGKFLVDNLSPDFAYRVTASASKYHKAAYSNLVEVRAGEVTEHIDFQLEPMSDYFIAKRESIQELRDIEAIYVDEENRAEEFLESLEGKGGLITDAEKEALQRLYLVENFSTEAYYDAKRLAQLGTDGLGGFIDVGMAIISTCGGVGEAMKKVPFVGKYLASPYIAAKNDMVNQMATKSHIFLYQNYDVTWTLKGDILLREAIGKSYDKIFIKASEELAQNSFFDAMAEVHKFIEKEFFLSIYEVTTANFMDESVSWAEESPPVFRVGRFANAENKVNQIKGAMNFANDEKIKRAETLIWAGDTIGTAGAIASGVVLAGGVVLSALSTKTVIGAPLAAVLIPLSTKIAIATNTAAAGMKLGTTAGISVYLWATIPNYVREGTAYSFDMSPSDLASPAMPVAMRAPLKSYRAENSKSSGLHAPSMQNLTSMQNTMLDYNNLLGEIREYIQNEEPEEVQQILEPLIDSGESLAGDVNVSIAQILAASPQALREVADYDAIYSSFEADLSKASSERIAFYTLLASYLVAPNEASVKELLLLQTDKTRSANKELGETLTTTTETIREARIAIPTLVIIKSFSTPDVVPPAESFIVSAQVKNIGQASASDVNVKLSVSVDSGLILMEPETKVVGQLNAGEERDLNWELRFAGRRRAAQEAGVNLVTISVSSTSDTPDFDTLPPTHIFIPSMLPSPPTGGKLSNKNVYAYPNPFNPDIGYANIRYSLNEDASVTIKIYDVSGALVITLVESQPREKKVEYSETWDGRNAQGDVVSNGVYFYLITTDTGEKAVGKLAVLR